MANGIVRDAEFYSNYEEVEGVVPYREYWGGDVVLASNGFESPFGGDIVSAADHVLGGQEALADFTGDDTPVDPAHLVEKIPNVEIIVPRTDADLDPWDAEGFLQSEFVPEVPTNKVKK